MKLSRAGILFSAILGAGLCGHAAGQDPPAPDTSSPTKETVRAPEEGSRDAFLLQYGETVLPIEKAAADAPRQRRAEDPWIEIVSLKNGDKRLLMEFNVVQGKPESYSVVLKSASGRKVCDVRGGMVTNVTFSNSGAMLRMDVRANAQGLQQIELPDVGDRVETWIEYEPGQPQRLQGFGPALPAGIKISRSATLGAVGQLTYSRTWTDAEKQAAENLRLENASPPPPPEGHVVISESTKPLIAGMPILIVEAGQWTTSELLAVGPKPKRLIVRKAVKSQATGAAIDRARCAVSREMLKQAESDPAQFKPSLRVFPGSGTVLTKDFELITPSMNLAQGMVLLSSQHGECTFAGPAADGKLNVRTQFSQGKLQPIDHSMAAIKSSDAAKLSDQNFVATSRERYRSYLRLVDREADLKEESDDVQKKLQQFHPTGNRTKSNDPPPGVTPLTPTGLVRAELPVLFYDSSRWHVAVVIEDSPEGRVDIRSAWPYPGREFRVARKALFITPGARGGDSNPGPLISDQTQRKYTFAVAAAMLPFEVRQVLTKDLGSDPLDPGLRSQPFTMELTAVKTRLEAQTIEYRLLAGGATVSVKQATNEAD